MPSDRDLMDKLGRSFDMLKSAHYSVRACLRNEDKSYAELALRQWARGVTEYTDALEALLEVPKPSLLPPSPSEQIEIVRSRVLGRIKGGRFIKEE